MHTYIFTDILETIKNDYKNVLNRNNHINFV